MQTKTKRLWSDGETVTCESHASDDLLFELRRWPTHSIHHCDDAVWGELAEADLLEFAGETGTWIDCDAFA